MKQMNLIVGQSGGPTAVINSSLYGVVSEGFRHPDAIGHVYGMANGIAGFLEGNVLDFAQELPGGQLEQLKTTPGAYLGSCRYRSGGPGISPALCPFRRTEYRLLLLYRGQRLYGYRKQALPLRT